MTLISFLMIIFSSTMASNNTPLRVGNPIFPGLLGVSPGAVYRRFAPDAPLVTSGLVSIDDEGQVSLISQLARLHWLPKVAGSAVPRLLLGEAGPAELRWSDFDHVARQLPSPSNQRPPGTQLTNREGRRELLALVACWWRAR